jgi:hypothetical protein
MCLTGRTDGPPLHSTGAPATFARAALRAFDDAVGQWGAPTGLDGAGLLGERAALLGLCRRGDVSAGGGTRLLEATDGWVALTLSRPDDLDVVPALVGHAVRTDEWDAVGSWARRVSRVEFVARAALLGLPVAALGERAWSGALWRLASTRPGRARAVRPAGRSPLVVNLGSLWAAPLAAHLLSQAGATVVDVETEARPDPARTATPTFYGLLHEGSERFVADFDSAVGRRDVAALLRDADIVLEASRPRALRALGLAAEQIEAPAHAQAWIRITGHGPSQPGRVAFGDDAAVAGGLVGWDAIGPTFAGDAISDPLTGMTAALVAAACLSGGVSILADLAMADVAAACVALGPTVGSVQPTAPWVPSRVAASR